MGRITAMRSPMDATPHIPRQIEIPYLGHYCLKTFEMAKDKEVGAAKSQSWVSGLSYQQLRAA